MVGPLYRLPYQLEVKMNFPDNAFIRFLYWLINSPGIGGITVSLLGIGIVTAVGSILNWIARGRNADETEVYSYPTPALHQSQDHRD